MSKQPIKLKERFASEILPGLQKELKVKNVWAAPRLKKISINVGLGSFLAGKKDYSIVVDNLAAITGQKPVVTIARKSISNFKIREGIPVGVTVTIRGEKMLNFVNKFVNITLPRIRDFRGLPMKGFDGKGNYTLGITENIVFPEINPDNIDKIYGMEITFVTTAQDNESGIKLFKALGFPFQVPKDKKA